jgi:hypothetical protein
MARIPDQVIERLKDEVSVQRLAEARGVTFSKHGADLIGRCPFHEDKTPSLVVTPAKNLWHCLGACQAGGTVIDWVMCVIHVMSVQGFTACRSSISRHAGQGFHGMSVHDFTACRSSS